MTISGGQTIGGGGGGIWNAGTLTVSNSVFSNNVSNQGAGIFDDAYFATAMVIDCSFTNNNTSFNGEGGGIWSGGPMTVLDCSFTNNTAVGGDGGGIFNNGAGGILTVTNSTFISNTAASGGGIFNNSAGGATVTDCAFANNSAVNPDPNILAWGYGGAIFSGAMTTVDGCTFTDNSATSGGGGISDGYACTLSLSDSLFADDSAAYGGGIYNNGTTTLGNIIFNDNSASFGGSINNNYGTLEATDGTVTGNSATYSGGGIDIEVGATTTLTNYAVERQFRAPRRWPQRRRHGHTNRLHRQRQLRAGPGGGLEVDGGGTLTLTNCTVSGNSALGNTAGAWSTMGR